MSTASPPPLDWVSTSSVWLWLMEMASVRSSRLPEPPPQLSA